MKLPPTPGALTRTAWLLGVILFLGSAYFYQDPEWNGNSRLDLTRSVVELGRLDIDAFHDVPGWATGDKAFFDGHYYSDKAIGASLLGVPIYFVASTLLAALKLKIEGTALKHLLTTGVMGSSFTLAGISMFWAALGMEARPWKAAVAALVVSFGTMLWPYSAVFYGHLPAAACLVASFALLIWAGLSPKRGSRAVWFWIGFGVSLAFISDFTAAPVILGLAAYALYVLRGDRLDSRARVAWTAVPGLLIPLTILFAYNMAVFGTPIASGYAHEVEERFQEIMGLGLMGMRLPTLGASYHISLDPRFGLLWLSPFLVLAPIGYIAAFKDGSHRAEAVTSIYAITVVFLMNAASFLWYGGSAFGPRLLISALPFFIIPLTLLPDRWMWPLAALGLVSAANMMIPLLGQIQYTRLEFDPERGGFFVAGAPFRGLSLLYEYGLPQICRLLRAGTSPWTLGSALGLPLGLGAAALWGCEAGLIGALHRACLAPQTKS